MGLIVATALLNVGLFFMLYFLAPILAGLVCGYLVQRRRASAGAAFLGALVVYVPLNFLLADSIAQYLVESGVATMEELQGMLPVFYADLVVAGLVMSLLGALGGLLGALLAGSRRRPGGQLVPVITE